MQCNRFFSGTEKKNAKLAINQGSEFREIDLNDAPMTKPERVQIASTLCKSIVKNINTIAKSAIEKPKTLKPSDPKIDKPIQSTLTQFQEIYEFYQPPI